MGLSYHAEQWVPRPVEEVFGFFADPRNLVSLMPAWQCARIDQISIVPPPPNPDATTDAPTVAAGTGTQLTLSFRPFPFAFFRVRWVAEICNFAWNNFFCDSQRRGPFESWKHCHHVRAEAREGIPGTLIVDDVEYSVPFDVLGRLADQWFVRGQVERSFDYRQARLATIFAPVKAEPVRPLAAD